jgi:hypothetical protein
MGIAETAVTVEDKSRSKSMSSEVMGEMPVGVAIDEGTMKSSIFIKSWSATFAWEAADRCNCAMPLGAFCAGRVL